MSSDKYPRTSHVPWSPGLTNDERCHKDIEYLVGKELVVTEKLDGSNLCLEREAVYARSHNGAPSHPSFAYAKSIHAAVSFLIPYQQQVFGEYAYAVHSIAYDALPNYFLMFGIRENAHNAEGCGAQKVWLAWEHVEKVARDFCKGTGSHFPTVPVLWRGKVASAQALQGLTEELSAGPSTFGGEKEGLVVRVASGFNDEEFPLAVAKWVRANHVQTDEHWTSQATVRQKLK